MIPTGALANYRIEIYFNGATTPGTTIPLSSNASPLSPCNSWILADNGGTLAITPDQTSSSNFWNGNDVIILREVSTGRVVDSMGTLGVDPGTGWTGGGITTNEKSLCRKEAVLLGDNNPNDAFNPSTEWMEYSQNTVFSAMDLNCKCSANPNKLLITGYIEGSSNNKVSVCLVCNLFRYHFIDLTTVCFQCLRISSIDDLPVGELSDYEVVISFNGGTFTRAITLGANAQALTSCDSWVLADNDNTLACGANQQDSGNFWNGNDAIFLRHVPTGTIIDSFGQVGNDPGTEWSASGVGTADESLCRKSTVTSGDTNTADVFDPSVEWTTFTQNTVFSSMTSSSCKCPAGTK